MSFDWLKERDRDIERKGVRNLGIFVGGGWEFKFREKGGGFERFQEMESFSVEASVEVEFVGVWLLKWERYYHTRERINYVIIASPKINK